MIFIVTRDIQDKNEASFETKLHTFWKINFISYTTDQKKIDLSRICLLKLSAKNLGFLFSFLYWIFFKFSHSKLMFYIYIWIFHLIGFFTIFQNQLLKIKLKIYLSISKNPRIQFDQIYYNICKKKLLLYI